MKRHLAIVVIAFVALIGLGLQAQESAVKGSLGGTVLDSSGAVVTKAKLTLTGPTGNKETTSDSEGRFVFDLLTPGAYKVKAEMSGFRAVEVQKVEVSTGRQSTVRLTLEPGGGNQVVEVSAEAAGVDVGSTSVSTSLNDTFYEQVPIGRNVTNLFYASSGVADGGGTGAANPSIAGGTGLENQYVADGVNITDGAFGGIGVFSRLYGSLGSGINLSFVKEVNVKTGGYEAQYGKSTGGLVQIVTKSGGNEYHGAISAFFAPQKFEATRLSPDSSGLLNQGGVVMHQAGYDVSGEFGGFVPRLKDHLFFFGSFNPSWNRNYDQFSNQHGVSGFSVLANTTIPLITYNYASKLTYKINDKNVLESSVFGDPTRESDFSPNITLATYSKSTFSKLSNGTRNLVGRYNGTLSPTWLVNASFSWGHNYLTETPQSPNTYQIADLTGRGSGASNVGPLGPLTGTFTRQGLGLFENTTGDNYSTTFDTQKVVNKFGQHTLYVGYSYERNSYAGVADRTGAKFTVTPGMADSGAPTGAIANAAGFQLRSSGGSPVIYNVPGLGPTHVILRQTRGSYSSPAFDTHGRYHAAYVNDSWEVNRFISVNAGYRWEQQFMLGSPIAANGGARTHYTFTDNWSPRFGLSIDPKGDRKTKIYGNFARYSYAIPLDLAIRSLSNEQDLGALQWLPVADASNNLVVNADGSLPNPILDDAHYAGALSGVSNSQENIAPGTKMQYLQEWVAGVTHEFPHGIVVDVRWQDRRLKRIVEDMSGISPEAADAGITQNFVIANPSPSTDLFVNPVQLLYNSGDPVPAQCPATDLLGTPAAPVSVDPVQDTFGNTVAPGAMCVVNPGTAANPIAGARASDGKGDGFAQPIRVYKTVEVEITKAFSHGWQWRTNYRWSTLLGNYEGAFRNDNGQGDPSISSLFDFTAGQFGLLGNQFGIGFLNTDRRHILNNFFSYTFTHSFLKNLTLGTGVRIESGIPINDLKAHPVYQNAGEIPVGGRGSLGREPWVGEGDLHADYAFKLRERQTLQIGADFFNVANQQTLLLTNQNEDRSFGVPNFDFKQPFNTVGGLSAPLTYQRPFYARFNVKWSF